MEEKVFKLVLGCVRISLSHKLLSFHIWCVLSLTMISGIILWFNLF